MEPTNVRPTSTSKYVRDFESLFVPIRVDELRNKARNGQLKQSQFRSVCWRYFMNCLPEQYDQWLSSCSKTRQRYESIVAKYASAKPPVEHPVTASSKIRADTTVVGEHGDKTNLTATKIKELEEERQYLEAASQCDHSNIFRTIERDVVRTFPDMEFFRQSEMQSILENVLFHFASEHPNLSYKQGMHELLATLLYVLHTDSHHCLINHQGGYANDTIATLLDLKYLEHDVYHLFTALMKSIESWYQNDEILMVPEATGGRENGGVSNRPNRHQVSSVLGVKLKMISENIVRNYDVELFNHLEALQIAPQIYGIRWMRLLFGREFEFLDLLLVWDAIICDSSPMSLTDYVFASMLIAIRERLVNGDYTDCLNNLMRHQFKDVQYVIKMALHLRDPRNNPRPRSPQINKLNPTDRDQRWFFSTPSQQAAKLASSARMIRNVKRPTSQLLVGANPIKDYEMRDLRSGSSSSSNNRGQVSRLLMSGLASSSTRNALNLSTESYDDLHSIVDYCWRLLSEQIDSLQRCLPKEKSLHSEDEIFVALAQLKKVRDVLKGSLRLEDELESHPNRNRS